MAFSETFNVRPWLESPAKWLRWAIQAGAAGKMDYERYNLQQFWISLQGLKGQASSQQDWAELLTLDAQSQEALGNHLRRLAEKLKQDLASWEGKRGLGTAGGAAVGAGTAGGLIVAAGGSAATGVGLPLAAALAAAAGLVAGAGYLGSKVGSATVAIPIPKLKERITQLGREASEAFAKAADLAAQASAAYAKAKTGKPQQATQTRANAQAAQKWAAVEAQRDTERVERIAPAETALLGIPMWGWAAAAAGVVLLLVSTGGGSKITFLQTPSPGGRR